MKRVVFSLEADLDLREIWNYVAEEAGSDDVADRLVDSITARCWIFERSPYAGTSKSDIEPGLRGFPFGNYLIYYRVTADSVIIARILHAARDQSSIFDNE